MPHWGNSSPHDPGVPHSFLKNPDSPAALGRGEGSLEPRKTMGTRIGKSRQELERTRAAETEKRRKQITRSPESPGHAIKPSLPQIATICVTAARHAREFATWPVRESKERLRSRPPLRLPPAHRTAPREDGALRSCP